MIKPNWDIFKAKFSDNTTFHFEWFCYLLFCKETNKPHGVFRYKNQSAIETDPVDFEGHKLGFQSKFYETPLSKNKAELLETLEKVRRDYPELTKLYLYTNQEWTQAFPKKDNPSKKAQKTNPQIEIDKKASDLGIELEWRTTSYFESPFVSQDCSDISKYFFVEENSLLKLLNNQERHTQSILKNIKEGIEFKGYEISIERTGVLASLINDTNQVTIVCGKGGVGKTVEVKKLYRSVSHTQPIFAFKATEFELNRLDDLLQGFYVEDFLNLFGDNKDKTIVIDSAEKLMDLNNQEPFKEFIDLSIKFEWKVIFTTRENYFDDLNYLCLNFLNVTPNKIYIPVLTEEELEKLSCRYNFEVPNDERLKNLLKLPFYLNEYLKFYDDTMKLPFDLSKFKGHLWNHQIKQGDIKREQVFSELALQRANEGKFYLKVKDSHLEAAKALLNDEILGVDGTSFFISHDIYEEWALEKYIDIAFKNKLSTKEYFTSIGQSLSIRRSFRLWLSEQLYINELEIKHFIENAIDDAIEPIWKDELIVAILLSDYSDSFFENFENDLLGDNLVLLQRICFILRIACKEIDNSILSQLGLKQSEYLYFTKPKGTGWSSLIDFVYCKKHEIGPENIKIFIPVLHEWNTSNKEGDTTRKASLLCLEYYKWLESEHSYVRSGKFTNSIINTIACGADEIKSELSLLIDEMCNSKENSRKISYEHFAKLILTDLTGLNIAKAIPQKTLELAEYLWLKDHKKNDGFRSYIDTEQIFGVTDKFEFNYHPDSAIQTPIFYLLKFSFKDTLDFILSFINKVTLNVVNHYGEHNFITHDFCIGNTNTTVYLDEHMWSAYRGTTNAPDLVKSILMALEKFFLENIKLFENDYLEIWLKYILSRTNSSAMCGVVSSIVLANRDRLFNVAKILFEVKEFIQFDTSRLVFDSQHKRQLEMLGGMFGGVQNDKMYHEERIKACDAEHRAHSLENLVLYYQFFVREGMVEELEVQRRKDELWKLLDRYYNELKNVEDSENSRLWRMSLARMDQRKMNITREVVDNQVVINFNPNIDSDLKNMSEKSLENQRNDTKYMQLNLWADNKLRQDSSYKKYSRYESNPEQAVKDLKKLIEDMSDENKHQTENFMLFNRSTHILVSAALIKYHREDIEDEAIILCTDIISSCLKMVFLDAYRFQSGDGINFCFNVIPEIFIAQPELRPILKLTLIAGLIRTDAIDIYGGQRFYAYAIGAISRLWNEFDEDIESLCKGYILLAPLYQELIYKIRRESLGRGEPLDGLWDRFYNDNKNLFDELINNRIRDIPDLSNLDMNTKMVALYLIPNNQNKWCKDLFVKLTTASAQHILSEVNDRSGDYHSKNEFLKKYTHYVLQSPKDALSELLKPMLDNFNSSEGSSDLLERFVYAQDQLDKYDNFWQIWGLFKPKIVKLSQDGYLNSRSEKIIKAYLFAIHWNAEAKSWHTFKDKNARFFKEMAGKLSHSPSTLYSFARLLNGVGFSCYFSKGIYWIATIIRSNNEVKTIKNDDEAVFDLNAFTRKYIYLHRAEIRRSPELMSETLVVLDFLIEQGEVSAYLLRESIV